MTKFFEINMLEGRTGSAKINEKWHSLAKVNAIGVDITNENIGTRNSTKTRGCMFLSCHVRDSE